MQNKTYFIGNDKTGDIKLFSVIERPNPIDPKYKDLQLQFPNSGLYFNTTDFNKLLNTNDEKDYSKSDKPHVSIHYNPSQSYLLIKRTVVDRKEFQICRVKDVRDGLFFAPVLLKIYGDTSRDCFKPKSKNINKSVRLNVNFDSKTDTLVVFFLVTKKGNEMYKDPEYPANFYEIDFGDFRLVVIYRYFNRPPLKQTINYFLQTPNDFVINGLEWWQVCNLLNDMEMPFVKSYFNLYPEKN